MNTSVIVDGQLKYGWGILLLGITCLVFVALTIYALFYDLDVWERPSELYSIIGLFIGFGVFSIYAFAEYFKVHGSYDNDGIVFHSPWTGTKDEKWKNLESIEFNSTANGYVLKFKSGEVIRLSSLLLGHGGVLEILEGQGKIYDSE